MIVQKYIENPLIIKKRKVKIKKKKHTHTKNINEKKKQFDIRVWVLVSNFNPLTIWYFDECYVRFTADDYSTMNL